MQHRDKLGAILAILLRVSCQLHLISAQDGLEEVRTGWQLMDAVNRGVRSVVISDHLDMRGIETPCGWALYITQDIYIKVWLPTELTAAYSLQELACVYVDVMYTKISAFMPHLLHHNACQVVPPRLWYLIVLICDFGGLDGLPWRSEHHLTVHPFWLPV